MKKIFPILVFLLWLPFSSMAQDVEITRKKQPVRKESTARTKDKAPASKNKKQVKTSAPAASTSFADPSIDGISVSDGTTFSLGGVNYKIVKGEPGTGYPYYLSVEEGSLGRGALTIPSEIKINGKRYRVLVIGDYAFYEQTSLTSVDIPYGVTDISFSAFNGCTGLTSVSLPSTLENIYIGAFYDCKSLKAITFPSSVKRIGKEAFANCSSLTSVVIPSSVIFLGDWVFSECKKLRSVTLPRSLSKGVSTTWLGFSGDQSTWFDGSPVTSINYQ